MGEGILMRIKRAAALLLAVMLVLTLMPVLVQAEDSWVLDELADEDSGYEPIPLLIIKINYDADGDGKDGFDLNLGSDVLKKTGEQWTHTADSYWNEICFSDTGKSLKNYYKVISNGSFYFYPAEETYASLSAGGRENDGVVTVTIPYKHPQSATGNVSAEDYSSRIAALKAADEYVDFASFDKNGDGVVSSAELAVVYVCGGYEYSSAYNGSNRDLFAVHAHYTSGSGCELDGVMVQNGGFVRVGEYGSSTEGITMGTIAHELGHFLGAADLYDTDHNGNGVKWNYASNLSLMSSGSHNSYTGERSGTSPSYLDPYHAIELGFVTAQTALDGTYTLYSRQSSAGTYNIIKVNTPDPGEYYLIENRNGDIENSMFDAIDSGARGIVIWHIDEYSITKGRINNEGSGHDPGIALLGVNSLSVPYGFFYNERANERYYTFDSSKYKFPISGTAYTSLTEEEAAEYGLKIEIISERGDEMQIKVTGAAALPPTLNLTSVSKTTSELTFKAKIRDLNGGSVTSCGLILSTKEDYLSDPNAKIVSLKPDEYGYFSYTFEDLSENTKYFCTAFTEGDSGRSEKSTIGYTAAVPVPRDYYVAHLYMGKTAAERSYDVNLKPGDTIPDAVTRSMKKSGYLFGGWYLDENYTERFDLNSTQTELADITLFAKWIDEELAAVLTIHNATSRYGMTFATEVGDTFVVPDIVDRAGYTFAGWYIDEALTTLYDFGTAAENTDGVDIYAKWVKDESEPPETTADPPDTAETTVPAETTAPTETTSDGPATTPTVTPDKGGHTGLILVIAAAVVIAAIAVIYILFKKKQNHKNEKE